MLGFPPCSRRTYTDAPSSSVCSCGASAPEPSDRPDPIPSTVLRSSVLLVTDYVVHEVHGLPDGVHGDSRAVDPHDDLARRPRVVLDHAHSPTQILSPQRRIDPCRIGHAPPNYL